MQRRKFLGSSLAMGMFLTDGKAQSERELEAGGTGSTAYALDVTVERKRPGHYRDILPQLSQPQHGRLADPGSACAVGLSVSDVESRHRSGLRPLGSLREESRSLRHRQSGRIGLLDGRLGMGLSGAFQG